MNGILSTPSGNSAERLKALAMLRAKRAGVAVFELGSGGYAVDMQAHEVPDLRALQRLSNHMGAPA
jgi:hypothetical protein